MSLDLLPCEEPRLVAAPLIAYSAGATQHSPVERQDAGTLEELCAHDAAHQHLIPPASASNNKNNSNGQRDGHAMGTRTYVI